MPHSLPSYDHTTTLLEDVFEPIINPYCPIYVIDFKVFAHFINNYSENAWEVAGDDEQAFRKICRAMWAYKLNRGPDMLKPFPFVAFVTDDMKGQLPPEFSEHSITGTGYWRHIEAAKLDMAEYKGGRGEKTELFNIIQEEGYAYIDSPGSTFHYFAKDFFEADDIAGHICRLKRAAHPRSKLARRQLFLGTLDGDWSGLASDPHGILWANTGPWLPRLRSEREVCDYYLRKEGMHITSARGCYDFKVEYGDMGDNLPPGTPLRFFNLYDEDSEWRFTKSDTDFILKVLNSTTPSNRSDHMEASSLFLRRRGLFLPEIPETHDEDKKSYFERAIKARIQNSHPEITGRGRKLCFEEVGEKSPHFDKCKELVLDDISAKEKIKAETENLRLCKEAEDTKCIKELRAIIRGLKDLRDAIKAQLAKLTTLS